MPARTEVQWRHGGAHFPVTALVAREALRALRREVPLTAANVVDAARTRAHPLHPCFEWDDAIAAEEHRASTARLLMRSIVVIRGTGDRTRQEPQYVAVRRDGESARAYEPSVWCCGRRRSERR